MRSLKQGSQRLDLNKIKLFDSRTLNINNIENTLNDPTRNIIEEFDLPSENFNDFSYLSRILKGYRGAEIHPKKFQILYYLARTHEAITSPKIFDSTRVLIGKKEMFEHISQTSLKAAPMIKSRRY